MDSFFDSSDLPFAKSRVRKFAKFAILLNEPAIDPMEEAKNGPCSLASELLPDLMENSSQEDLVTIIGDILKEKIIAHAEVKKVPIFKPDDIKENNPPMLIPVMYRIATENFAQSDKSTFKIIECRNETKLISDWKPSLPDKLVSLGHQVIVVQLETSFVPYTDFAYAILRQLECDWKTRLPRSFFFPDDVCKVESTSGRDLCVVSPSMPDGDLEINKKIGLLNYEVLMMIKSSCMSAMKNYLMKRDLRVGKFSDTLDGVAALRQLYRQLQDKLRSGESVELGSNTMEDLKRLVKQSIGGTDVLASQTWIEYGKRIGLPIPASASSSATSISSARDLIDKSNSKDENDDYGDLTSSSSSENESERSTPRGENEGAQKPEDPTPSGPPVAVHDDDDADPASSSSSSLNDSRGDNPIPKSLPSPRISLEEQEKDSISRKNEGEQEDDDDDFKLETFMEFRDSLERKNRRKNRKIITTDKIDDDEDDDSSLSEQEFLAESIIQILQLPQNHQKITMMNQ